MGKKDKPDFPKAKKKLGKPAKGVTATNLQFQTKGFVRLHFIYPSVSAFFVAVAAFRIDAIYMPEQSVTEEKGEYVTNRNQSAEDLLPQLKHHNEHVRRDALLGLKDLLVSYPQLLSTHLGSICERAVETMVDLEHPVRQALHTLLDTVLPRLTEDLIAPFFPLFVVYMTSALTHLKQSIRLDAVGFINLWLKHFPGLVASQHHKFLRHFVTVLMQREPAAAGIPRTNTSNTSDLAISGEKVHRLQRNDAYAKKIAKIVKLRAGSPTPLQAKLSVLSSLYLLLQKKLEGSHLAPRESFYERGSTAPQFTWRQNMHNAVQVSVVPDWKNSFSLEDVFEGQKSASILTREADKTENQIFVLPTNLSSAPSLTAPITNDIDFDLDSPVHLMTGIRSFLARVAPLLLVSFVECEPANIQTLTAVNHLKLILSCYELLVRCVKNTFMDHAEAHVHLKGYLLELLKYVVPHFPFECPAGWPETAVAETNALNIAVCKILSVFMVPSVAGRHEVDSMEVDESQPEWVHTIIQYVTGALAGRVQFRHARASAPETQVLGERLTKAEYAQLVELLPVVKVMLGSAELTTLNSNLLIEAFNQVFAGCPAKSVSKRECIYFIADILLDEIASTRIPAHATRDWLTSLPKVLWQMQDTNPGASSIILAVLKHQGIRMSTATTSQEDFDQFESLQKALTPFFYTEVREPKSGKVRSVFGPFVSLPTETQRAAIELLYYFKKLSPALLNGLVRCVTALKESDSEDESVYCVDESVIRFMFEVLTFPTSIHSLPTYAGFLLSVFLATCKLDGDQQPSWSRIKSVSRSIAWSFHSLQLGSKMLHLFDETILKLIIVPDSLTVKRAAIYLLGRCCKLGSPSIALPSSMDRNYALADALAAYLKATFSASGDTSADIKACAGLLKVFPGTIFRRVLAVLLLDATSSNVIGPYLKSVFSDIITTHQRTLSQPLRHEKESVLAIRDAILKRESRSHYSIRMEAELNVLYNI